MLTECNVQTLNGMLSYNKLKCIIVLIDFKCNDLTLRLCF